MTTPRNLSRLASGANTSGVLALDKGGTGAASATDAKTALNLHTVATTGSYNDLANKPALGDALPAQTGNSGKYLTTSGTTPSWATVETGGGPIAQNATSISTNQVLASGSNGQSVGPISVNTGVTVTVGTGQRWIIH